MEILIYLKSVLMGVVEGLTEFIPVSSTGHLIIVGEFLKFHGEKAKMFEVFIQLGAILAVCWEYRSRFVGSLRSVTVSQTSQKFWLNLVVATLPAMFFGLLFHKTIKLYLFNSLTVALALILGGLFMLWIESRKHVARVTDLNEMDWKTSLKVGFAQLVSLCPGVSRAAATIMGGMLAGLSRSTATLFSFFLAIPTLSGAALLDLYKGRALLSAKDTGVFGVGFVVSFLIALVVIRWLIRYVSEHGFRGFALYRIFFGTLILALHLFGVLSLGR